MSSASGQSTWRIVLLRVPNIKDLWRWESEIVLREQPHDRIFNFNEPFWQVQPNGLKI
jgi:hypothetical protein